jgi:hypothetical protein
MADAQLGAIHLTLPGRAADQGAELVLTRAFNRAWHIDPDDWGPTIGELFGERWMGGVSAGFWRVEDTAEAASRIRGRKRHFEHDELEIELELVQAELEEVKSRRAVRLANAVGVIVRARSLEGLRVGLKSLVGALRGAPSS